ncbi:MAG: DUF2993 domain-containing protein [Chroococcidiopsidaceae cyanobacterium CP_BM_ER_R8_30]|nr:DUF2993 domain-containing protein [Chroococcidiopsidaceae cyanobacterium CP_BM_ER_R8_30]
MTPEMSGLGEQALNKMAEMAIASQIETAENLEVQVKIDPSNLAKGEVDALAIKGEGLLMHPDLRMAKLQMQINSIAVKPFKALFGRIELVKPTVGTAQIVITEADLDYAFNSEKIHSRLRQTVLHLDGKQLVIKSVQVTCNLLSDGKIAMYIKLVPFETEASKQFSFTATLSISADEQTIVLQDIQYPVGKEPPLELTHTLAEWASEILNLQNFEMEGILLYLHQVAVEAGNLILQAEALVTQFPGS